MPTEDNESGRLGGGNFRSPYQDIPLPFIAKPDVSIKSDIGEWVDKNIPQQSRNGEKESKDPPQGGGPRENPDVSNDKNKKPLPDKGYVLNKDEIKKFSDIHKYTSIKDYILSGTIKPNPFVPYTPLTNDVAIPKNVVDIKVRALFVEYFKFYNSEYLFCKYSNHDNLEKEIDADKNNFPDFIIKNKSELSKILKSKDSMDTKIERLKGILMNEFEILCRWARKHYFNEFILDYNIDVDNDNYDAFNLKTNHFTSYLIDMAKRYYGIDRVTAMHDTRLYFAPDTSYSPNNPNDSDGNRTTKVSIPYYNARWSGNNTKFDSVMLDWDWWRGENCPQGAGFYDKTHEEHTFLWWGKKTVTEKKGYKTNVEIINKYILNHQKIKTSVAWWRFIKDREVDYSPSLEQDAYLFHVDGVEKKTQEESEFINSNTSRIYLYYDDSDTKNKIQLSPLYGAKYYQLENINNNANGIRNVIVIFYCNQFVDKEKVLHFHLYRYFERNDFFAAFTELKKIFDTKATFPKINLIGYAIYNDQWAKKARP